MSVLAFFAVVIGLLLAEPEPAPRLPLLVHVRSGDPLAGLGDGATYLDVSAPTVNEAGQMVYAALTKSRAKDGKGEQLGFGVFRHDPDQNVTMVLHVGTEVEADPRRWILHDDVECAINEQGQVAAIGFGPGVAQVPYPEPGEARWPLGSPRPNSGQIVFGPAKEAGKSTLVARAGERAPGLEGEHVFHWFDLLRLDDEGAVYFRAGTAPKGKPPRSTLDAAISWWRAEPGERPAPILRSGGTAPGCEGDERVRVSGGGKLKHGRLLLDGAIVAAGARPEDPARDATWSWTPSAGLELLARRGDEMKGLTPPDRLGFATPLDVCSNGDVLFYASPEGERSRARRRGGEATGIWVRTAQGDWRKVVSPGDRVPLGGEQVDVVRVGDAQICGSGVLVLMAVRRAHEETGRFSHWSLWLFEDGSPPRRVLGERVRPEGINWPEHRFRPGTPIGVTTRGDIAIDVVHGEEVESGRPKGGRHSAIWLLTRDGRQYCVQISGISMRYAPGRASAVWRTEKSWTNALAGDGRIAFKAHFEDGTTAVIISSPPPSR